VSNREPDVEMAARVRAKELRFECKPQVELGAHANAPATVEHTSERDNLPDEVEPGKTYRNVEVRWRLAARLDDRDPPDR
jgi:hypothetical protein